MPEIFDLHGLFVPPVGFLSAIPDMFIISVDRYRDIAITAHITDLFARGRHIVKLRTGEPDVSVSEDVAAIWAAVLSVDNVPPGATFFELGGHSLLAIRLLNRVKDSLGVDLPLTTLFTHASIEDFTSRVVAEIPSREPGAGLPPQASPSTDLDELLAEIEAMSDEEAAALLRSLEEGDVP